MNIEFGHNKNSRDLGIKFHNVSYFDNNAYSENEKVDLFLCQPHTRGTRKRHEIFKPGKSKTLE